MARKSMDELRAQALATLPDNIAGDISPEDVRTLIEDLINAIAPAYGVLSLAGPSAQLFGVSPVKMLWSSSSTSDLNEVVVSTAQGWIARTERGTSTVNLTVDFECILDRDVTFILYKNGTPTTWRVTGSGKGAGNKVSVSLAAIDYADPAAEYSIWASCEVNSTAVTMSDSTAVLSVMPVNSYV